MNSKLVSKQEIDEQVKNKNNRGCNNLDNVALIFDFLVSKIYEKEKYIRQKEFFISSKTQSFNMMDQELSYLRKKIKVMEIEDERNSTAKFRERSKSAHFGSKTAGKTYKKVNRKNKNIKSVFGDAENNNQSQQFDEKSQKWAGNWFECQNPNNINNDLSNLLTKNKDIENIVLQTPNQKYDLDKENLLPNTQSRDFLHLSTNSNNQVMSYSNDLPKSCEKIQGRKRFAPFATTIVHIDKKRFRQDSPRAEDIKKSIAKSSKSQNLPFVNYKESNSQFNKDLNEKNSCPKKSVIFATVDAIDLEADGANITSDSVSMISTFTNKKHNSTGYLKLRSKKSSTKFLDTKIKRKYYRRNKKTSLKESSSTVGFTSKRIKK